MTIDFAKMGGLVPAIVQDSADGTVLMLGFMNEEALAKTLATKQISFYSRTRRRLWTKGESSGNTLEMLSWSLDCDADTLLFQVEARGPTCHSGTRSCFPEQGMRLSFLHELEKLIQTRKTASTAASYTARLLNEGPQRIAQKIGEEGVEVALALASGDDDELVNESADLLYHLLVGLSHRGLSLSAVVECLSARHSKA